MERVLSWDACLNVRDLGGLPAGGGRTIRRGAIVRADTLCRLTPEGQQALLDHGVRTVVDLRYTEEQTEPHPFADPTDGRLRYHNLFMSGSAGRDEATRAAFAAAQGHAEHYRVSVDMNRAGIGAIVRTIARAPEGGVLIHCHAGKDRTGIIVALLLSLVGVPDDVIAADYALSYPNLIPVYDALLDERGVTDPAERARLHASRRSDPETILATLAHVRERHGGPESYFLAAGLTPDDLAALRTRLLD